MCDPALDDLDGAWFAGFKTDSDRTVETPEIEPYIMPVPAEEPVAVPA